MKNLKNLAKMLGYLSKKIMERNDSFQSKKAFVKMCEDCHNVYQKELDKLSKAKDSYFDSLNKTIEYYLNQKSLNKLKSNKVINELQNKKN